MMSSFLRTSAVVGVLAILAGPAMAVTYIGDAAPQGLAVTSGGGPRADTVGTLTYALHTGSPTIYTAPSNQQLKLTEVNFFADRSGTLSPFVARFLGGSTQTAANYQVLAKGDALGVVSSDQTMGPSAGDHLENRAFTVATVNPTINVNAGDQIVAGWLQQGNVVYIGAGGAQGAGDYVKNGDSLSGAVIGGPLTANSNYNFDRHMQFNIGFVVNSTQVTGDTGNWDLDWVVDPHNPGTLTVEKTANDSGPFDMEITVTGGLTTININETVLNPTMVDWSDYHVQLGTGLGGGFVASAPSDGLSFISGTSATFPTATAMSEDELAFSGSLVGPLNSDFQQLQVQVPGADPYTFTLRQWPTFPTGPTIPEPMTMLAVGLGITSLGGYIRKRRRG